MDSVMQLTSNIYMPMVSMGLFKVTKDEMCGVIKAGLSCGYRSFDTASVYRNEQAVGEALQQYLPELNLKRGDVFVTTKLGPKEHGFNAAREACHRSLTKLHLDYIDLYLVHWPGGQGLKPEDEKHPQLRKETWRQLEVLLEEGKVKAIGVSNYTAKHLEELLSYCKVKPAILQTEHHPHCIQSDVLVLCQQHNIKYQAYSSLGSTANKKLIEDPTIQQLSLKYNVSPVRVLLRWSVQQGIGVIPKSTDAAHICDNIKLWDFSIGAEDMAKITDLNENKHYCWHANKVT